jgi:hypothetical protein
VKPKWAAEPWKSVEGKLFIKKEEGWGSIVNAQDWFIAKLEDTLDPEANAERIVACVNGCTGLDPAALPEAVAAMGQAQAVLARGALGQKEASDLASQLGRALDALRNFSK